MILGITGGVGSGKSTVLDYLKLKYNAVIIVADDIGKYVIEKGYEGYHMVREAFPEVELDENGNFNRSQLANIVFNDEEKLNKLNSIVHPLVKSEILKIIRENQKKEQNKLIVIEAALLIEDGYDSICDEIWYVYCEKEERIRRLEKSRGYSREKSHDIMCNQLSEDEFKMKTQACIDNTGDPQDTKRQIDILFKKRNY